MQHIDDDMDELFQRAADRYPLKVAASEWDKIAGNLYPGEGKQPVTVPKRRVWSRKTILLLVLLLLGGGAGVVLLNHPGHIPGSPGSIPGTAAHSPKSREPLPQQKPGGGLAQIRTPVLGKISEEVEHPGSQGAEFTRRQDPCAGSTNFVPYMGSNYVRRARLELPAPKATFLTGNIHQLEAAMQEGRRPGIQIGLLPQIARKSGTGYLGFVGGGDVSRVRSQDVPRLGYDLGLVGGYNLGNRWAVETGLVLGKKLVYSNGAHFSMDKLAGSMPSGMKLMSVESEVHLLEIPVNLRYRFAGDGKTGFVATAGLSSYVLLREKNNYQMTHNGNPENMTGQYSNKSFVAPATLNLGAAYTLEMPRGWQLRIEPYVKVPLKGVGIGRMPVSSSGLHIGITRPFR